MPFIIVLWILIDTLVDQRRYPGWIRVSQFKISYLPCDCNLLFSFASHLSSFLVLPDTLESHITFQTVQRKGQTFPLILLLSYWCESQKPVCSGWNGSWSKTSATQGKKVEQDPSLLSAQADLTLSSMNEEIASYKILDVNSNTNTFFRSCQGELDRDYLVFKYAVGLR